MNCPSCGADIEHLSTIHDEIVCSSCGTELVLAIKDPERHEEERRIRRLMKSRYGGYKENIRDFFQVFPNYPKSDS